jgi:hypothetical protein
MKTIQELAKEALDVQDACNLRAVVRGLSRVMDDLWKIADEEKHGSDWVHHHPIVTMWIDKLAHLNGSQQNFGTKLDAAYDQVNAIIKGGA